MHTNGYNWENLTWKWNITAQHTRRVTIRSICLQTGCVPLALSAEVLAGRDLPLILYLILSLVLYLSLEAAAILLAVTYFVLAEKHL